MMETREPLEWHFKQLDHSMGLSFKANFNFALVGHLLKGTRHPVTNTVSRTIRVLNMLLSIIAKCAKRDKFEVTPQSAPYLAALVSLSEEVRSRCHLKHHRSCPVMHISESVSSDSINNENINASSVVANHAATSSSSGSNSSGSSIQNPAYPHAHHLNQFPHYLFNQYQPHYYGSFHHHHYLHSFPFAPQPSQLQNFPAGYSLPLAAATVSSSMMPSSLTVTAPSIASPISTAANTGGATLNSNPGTGASLVPQACSAGNLPLPPSSASASSARRQKSCDGLDPARRPPPSQVSQVQVSWTERYWSLLVDPTGLVFLIIYFYFVL